MQFTIVSVICNANTSTTHGETIRFTMQAGTKSGRKREKKEHSREIRECPFGVVSRPTVFTAAGEKKKREQQERGARDEKGGDRLFLCSFTLPVIVKTLSVLSFLGGKKDGENAFHAVGEHVEVATVGRKHQQADAEKENGSDETSVRQTEQNCRFSVGGEQSSRRCDEKGGGDADAEADGVFFYRVLIHCVSPKTSVKPFIPRLRRARRGSGGIPLRCN